MIPNNGECSIVVVPSVVIRERVGSSPIIHPKHEMIGSDSRRAVRTEDPTLTEGKDSISLYYVLVAQLVEH